MQSLPTVSTDWLVDWARLLLAEYAAARDNDHAKDVKDRLQPVLVELFKRGYSLKALTRLVRDESAVEIAA